MTVAYTFTECLHTNRCCAQRRFRSRVRATEKRSSATFFEHSVHQDLSGGDVQNVPQKLFFYGKTNYAPPNFHSPPRCSAARSPNQMSKLKALTVILIKSRTWFPEMFSGKITADRTLEYRKLYGASYRKMAKKGPIFPLNFSENHITGWSWAPRIRKSLRAFEEDNG